MFRYIWCGTFLVSNLPHRAQHAWRSSVRSYIGLISAKKLLLLLLLLLFRRALRSQGSVTLDSSGDVTGNGIITALLTI